MENITPVSATAADAVSAAAPAAAGGRSVAAPAENPPEKARVEYNPAQAQQALEAAIQNMNESARTRLRDLTFRVDEALGRPIISVVSSKTGDVVRQIPTEVALKVAHQIEDALGVFFDERA